MNQKCVRNTCPLKCLGEKRSSVGLVLGPSLWFLRRIYTGNFTETYKHWFMILLRTKLNIGTETAQKSYLTLCWMTVCCQF